MINVFQPQLGAEEVEAVKKVFASNWIGKGKLCTQFEESFADYIKASKANVRSTNCCSEGLFSSMKLFDIKPEDEVIMPTISFVGAANAVCANGSKLVLCDVDRRTLNARAEDIAAKITHKTKAIMIIHYGGVPAEMDEIIDLAKQHNLYLFEDSACSVSSVYKGKACGAMGDMGMWSFDAMKILVCGDGAMLYFKSPEFAKKAEKLMYFGLESKSGFSNSVDAKWWEYDLSCFGHRAIINDVTAAIALEQLKKLPAFIAKRKEIHDKYTQELKNAAWLDLPIDIPSYAQSSYYFYHIQLKNGNRDELAKFLRDNDIYTTFRYYPLHWVKYYGVNDVLENAEYAANNTLCIPIHQSLSDNDIDLVVSKIKEFGLNKHL
ncbi:MAG: DegT/DnrJ/EryC1/StrS family aminotransferase [Elusimicrobiota bacterium]|jgi:aminotransferase|nr:DegT/DnrJ/EryC1/StrS family aminotransferase [Elusimicrobiota bacterium]